MSVNFIKSTKGRKLAIYNDYTFSLNFKKKETSYWRCTEYQTKGCKAKLTFKHEQFLRFSGEHLHTPSPGKVTKRIFYERLKERSKNEVLTPVYRIYRQELEKELATSPGVASCLPAMKTAANMQYRVRKPKKPKTTSSQKKNNRTLVVLDQSLYKMEFVDSLKGGNLLILDGHIFKHQRSYVSSTYWACTIKRCHAKASLSSNNNRLLRVRGSHNHDPPEANVHRKRFFHGLKVRITTDPTESLSKIYREELEKLSTTSDNKSKLPSEKAAIGVMMKIREQVLHAANSTDKSIHSEPKDSNSDNPSSPKEDSSKLDASIPGAKSKKIIPEVCLTINVKRELAQADPYDPSLSPGPPCPQSATDTSISTIKPLEAMTCERLPANDVRTSSLNLQNEPDPGVEHQRPHTISRPHPGPSNATTVPLQNMACEQSLLNDNYIPSSYKQKRIPFMVCPRFKRHSNSYNKATMLPLAVMARNRFPAHNVYTPSYYQKYRLPWTVRSDHPSLSNNYQCPTTVPLQSMAFSRPPRLPSVNPSISPIALPEAMSRELLPRYKISVSSSDYQNKQKPRTPRIINTRLSSSCSDSSNAAILFAENLCKCPTSEKDVAQRLIREDKSNPRTEQLHLLSSKPHSSSIAKIPFVCDSCHRYTSTAVNLISGSPTLPNSNPDLSSSTPPLENITGDRFPTNKVQEPPLKNHNIPNQGIFHQGCPRISSSSQDPSNSTSVIPGKRYTADKIGAVSLTNQNKPEPEGALKGHFSFVNNCLRSYSHEPHHQITMNETFCTANSPSRPLNACGQCNHEYSGESSNHPTSNPLFQPLNVPDQCQEDYSHQSPNPPADNPLFQPPVLIKDEVVYSEEEEV